jgi:hypothetical protein
MTTLEAANDSQVATGCPHVGIHTAGASGDEKLLFAGS